MKRSILILALLLGGCTTTRYVTQPCVTGSIPAEPEKVQGKLTGDSGKDIGTIAASAIELRAWGRGLAGMLEACRTR